MWSIMLRYVATLSLTARREAPLRLDVLVNAIEWFYLCSLLRVTMLQVTSRKAC